MNLEHKLKAAAEPWLNEESFSPERAAVLERLVRRRRLRRWTRWIGPGAIAAVTVCGILFWPMIVAVASGTPVVGPYIARMAKYDEGAHWADQKGYVVPVNKSATDDGYTLRIESILADPARTVIYYEFEGPQIDPNRGFPPFWVEFNKERPGGGGSGRHEVVSGKIVGSLELPPLPTPAAVVNVRATEIAGVKGDWSVGFMASRSELDAMTRRIAVNQTLKGEGYELTIGQVLLAPTQAVVQVKGTVGPDVEVRPDAELVVNGYTMRSGGATYTRGGTAIDHRITFDRVNPEIGGELSFRLTNVVRWQEGGPAVALQSGVRTEHDGLWFEFVRVRQTESATAVDLRVPWDQVTMLRYHDLEDWVLIDAAGRQYPAVIGATTVESPGIARMQLLTSEPVISPVRVQALRLATSVPGEFTVRIPLK